MRLIDADKLKNWFNDHGIESAYKADPECEEGVVEEVVILIDGEKTVDPVRHGRWKMYNTYYACSVCGYEDMGHMYKYCPDCGAKMDGE